MIANYYKFSVPEEFVDKVLLQMKKVQDHFSANVEGCLKYQCTRDIEDKTMMYIFVIWEKREQYEKNLETDYQQKEIFDKFIDFKAAILSTEQFEISKMLDFS